jgi:hypothetical protein
MPLPFIKPQASFEQGEIGIVEMFPCLATMLSDFLFLQGASHPGGSILSFEVVQLQEVFGQHGFPLIKGYAHLLPSHELRVLPAGYALLTQMVTP